LADDIERIAVSIRDGSLIASVETAVGALA
jgi:hypothetical protein